MGVLSILLRPSELVALIKLKRKISKWTKRASQQKKDADWLFCYDMLNKVSRSFAIVIQQLGDELRNAVCIFYLVLRGLDTIEDDMAIDKETKTKLLATFYQKLTDEKYCLSCGYKDEKILVENFFHVTRGYNSLKPQYQEIICDITRRMADGMEKFTKMKVVTTKDYDLYCHYVAGLVGIGLSGLFAASGLEDPVIGENVETANHMGLFLQKTNIIRDFLEDHEDVNPDTGDRRVFWPKDIWGKYTDDLSNFTFGKNETLAVACLNDMVTNALQHLPYCIEYLSTISDRSNFLFCAIPQVMAAHTLCLCYANPDVFKGEIRKELGECRNIKPVKIRKGLSAKLMLDTVDMASVLDVFEDTVESIADRIAPTDPSAKSTMTMVQMCRDVIARGRGSLPSTQKICEGWKSEVTRSVKSIADTVVVPLIAILLVITGVFDVPQLMNLELTATANQPNSVFYLAMTAWNLSFYSFALFAMVWGAHQRNLKPLAMFHILMSFVEVGVLWMAAALGARQLLSETLPKLLAASCLVSCISKQSSMHHLTPSHPLKTNQIIKAVL
uniref:Squalene synthase n=1 Tax=Hanusia phi TaxID=3032 RepID=A0A6T7TMB5_9CRYP|mmetsp:Transcript_7431/g.16938  ORF Transcript_7431/g.16938 Transcript_7431/m.16938 type:complete len:558 (+) Transcript_7431:79-1752(+)